MLGPLYAIYRVTSYLRLYIGLFYINLQPKYELLSSTRFGQLQKFGKNISWGHRPPKPPFSKNFCMGSEFLFIATCASDFIFLAPITSEIKTVHPNWGPSNLIAKVNLEGPKRVRSGIIGFYGYDFLLVIICTRGRILYRSEI